MTEVTEDPGLNPAQNRPADYRVAVVRFLRETRLPLELLIVDRSTRVRAGNRRGKRSRRRATPAV